VYKSEKIAIFLSILILTTGLYLGVKYEGHYFARSGSLVVSVAVIFIFYHLEHNLIHLVSQSRELWESSKSDVIEQSVSEDEVSQEQASATVNSVINQFHTLLEDGVEKAKRRAVRIEASLLILGTLVWGFGDLVNLS
jgi:hypothetical protein